MKLIIKEPIKREDLAKTFKINIDWLNIGTTSFHTKDKQLALEVYAVTKEYIKKFKDYNNRNKWLPFNNDKLDLIGKQLGFEDFINNEDYSWDLQEKYYIWEVCEHTGDLCIPEDIDIIYYNESGEECLVEVKG